MASNTLRARGMLPVAKQTSSKASCSKVEEAGYTLCWESVEPLESGWMGVGSLRVSRRWVEELAKLEEVPLGPATVDALLSDGGKVTAADAPVAWKRRRGRAAPAAALSLRRACLWSDCDKLCM